MPIGIVSADDFYSELQSYASPSASPCSDSSLTKSESESENGKIQSDIYRGPDSDNSESGDSDVPAATRNPDSSLIKIAEILELKRGRGNAQEVPESVRALLGTTAIESGNKEAKVLSSLLLGHSSQSNQAEKPTSDSSISAYKNGATSTASYDSPDSNLKKKVDGAKIRISTKARARLLSALNHITPEKLADAKLRDVAATAQAMSAIIRNLEPPAENTSHSGVNFVFFAPRIRDEKNYDVIDAQSD